ncbi:MAG TPA: protein kinase [Candidatus Bathyarchaeia archaeon]|nr:protein kinase [Candidatus Bathyarchaeia archaeon]
MLQAGQTLLHYRILEKIGEGGMGAVYKAQDTHLDRFVAVKVLPHDRMADADRRQRFVQEAKAASSLNHPNIIVVHDIAADGGLDFIVMEYVEGRTLDQLIGRKGLRLNEALGYAAQIADGLAKAHAAGIVHRDLKPTNVMVTAEGRVKILDFGLAKLVEGGPAGDLGPTATLGLAERPRTEEGYILGTVSYMSPEQAEARPVDARSDIFAFGAVLYEMLTGQRAFQRESRIATLAAILNEEPKPAADLNDTLPPDVGTVLVRCLRKDPQRRWQNMADLRVVLQDLKDDSESGRLRRPEAAAKGRRIPALIWIGLSAALAIAAGALWLLRPKAGGPVEYEITRMTFDSRVSWSPSFSPDGKMFVYSSNRGGPGRFDIWLQQVAGGAPLRLTTDGANNSFPCFSPDGSKVAFNSGRDGGIFEIGLLGGSVRKLADRGLRPRYSPDGSRIVCLSVPAAYGIEPIKILLIPAKGGDPVLFEPEYYVADFMSGAGPIWSPDGRYILFNGGRIGDPSSLDWWAAPVAGGPPVRTGAHAALRLTSVWQSPAAWTGSYVYFSIGTTVEGVNIYRVRLDARTLKVSGPPEPITSGAGIQYGVSALADGRIVYAHITWLARLFTIDARPDEGLVTGTPAYIADDLTAKFGPALSLDGSKLVYGAFSGLRNDHFEVRVRDAATGKERAVPVDVSQFGQDPRLSPDGTVLSFKDVRNGSVRTLLMDVNEAAAREVCESCNIQGFYADPRYALVEEKDGGLVKLDLSTGQRTAVLETIGGRISEPALSPDDRYIAFILGKADGRAVLALAPLAAGPPAEKDWIVLFDEDSYLGSPAWSPNGRMLYYLSERDGTCKVWCQPLDGRTKQPVGPSRIAFDPGPYEIDLNVPRGNAAVTVGSGRLAIWAASSTGNIYTAAPKRKT